MHRVDNDLFNEPLPKRYGEFSESYEAERRLRLRTTERTSEKDGSLTYSFLYVVRAPEKVDDDESPQAIDVPAFRRPRLADGWSRLEMWAEPAAAVMLVA
ncbi:hypothetical protein Aduo_011293 [Ancylostoma duodenale]